MPPPPPKLTDLDQAYLAERTKAGETGRAAFDRENSRAISRLRARGITTNSELLDALPSLPVKLQLFGVWWLGQTEPPGAGRVLLKMLRDDPEIRLTCAHTLGMMNYRPAIREFIRVGTVQLSAPTPDAKLLEAVIPGLKISEDDEAVDILVAIYERTDLPGWLRGDAGDALGFTAQIRDRRTRVFHRVWAAAQLGLHDPDIDVEFWSMYVIMQLATNCDTENRRRTNCRFETVLPRLREIAATDHRLAPGYWWPMCEEAKDAIEVIETGNGPVTDAGESWQGNPERGVSVDRA